MLHCSEVIEADSEATAATGRSVLVTAGWMALLRSIFVRFQQRKKIGRRAFSGSAFADGAL